MTDRMTPLQVHSWDKEAVQLIEKLENELKLQAEWNERNERNELITRKGWRESVEKADLFEKAWTKLRDESVVNDIERANIKKELESALRAIESVVTRQSVLPSVSLSGARDSLHTALKILGVSKGESQNPA